MKTFLIAPLLFAAAAAAQTYTVSTFGPQCGAALQGQVVQAPTGAGMHLGVSGAHPNAVAILVIGHQHTTPVQLPGSQCLLLVDPRVTMHTITSANGHARFGFRLPPIVPITIDFQAVIARHTTHLVAESTNGVRVVGV